MRVRILLVLAALVGAVGLVATAAGVAVAANPAPLNGEELFSVPPLPATGVVLSGPARWFRSASPGVVSGARHRTRVRSRHPVVTLYERGQRHRPSGTFAIHDATDGADVLGTLSLNGSPGTPLAGDASSAKVRYTAAITTANTTSPQALQS